MLNLSARFNRRTCLSCRGINKLCALSCGARNKAISVAVLTFLWISLFGHTPVSRVNSTIRRALPTRDAKICTIPTVFDSKNVAFSPGYCDIFFVLSHSLSLPLFSSFHVLYRVPSTHCLFLFFALQTCASISKRYFNV